jgi:hypothetical protein
MLIFFHSLIFIYFLKRAIRDYNLMILSFSFVNKKEVQYGCRGHVFLLILYFKFTLYLSYIFIQKILFSYIILVKTGLTPWYRSKSERTSCDTSNNVCRDLQNWPYCFYRWRQTFWRRADANFQYQSQFLLMQVTDSPNVFVDQGQFSDPDFINATHIRENVQFANKLIW